MIKRKVENDTLQITDETGKTILMVSERLQGGSIMEMICEGEIKNEAAKELEDEMMASLSVCSELHIQLKEVSYIGSGVTKTLLAVQRAAEEHGKKGISLTEVSEPVREMLEKAGLEEMIEIN